MTTVVINDDKTTDTTKKENVPEGDRPLVKVTKRKSNAITVPGDIAPSVSAPLSTGDSPVEAARFVQLTNEVVQLSHGMILNGYEIGLRLKTIRDERLFAFGGFDSFEAYLASVEMSLRHGERYIALTSQFTPEDVRALGPKKCMIIVEARPELRPQLTEQAKGGASRRQLEQQIRANAAANRATTAEPKKTEPASNIPPEKRVTLVTREGLFAHVLKDRVTDKVATIESLKTQPAYATLVFENGAEQLVVVYVDDNTGELKLKVACKKHG